MINKVFDSSRPFAVYIVFCFVVCSANAHESHDARIQHLDTQLDQLPSGADDSSLSLLLRRADLHRRLGNWPASQHDYQHIAEVDSQNRDMLLGRAQLHLDQHQYAQSMRWSAKLMRLQADHEFAELLYARALVGAGEYSAASAAFENAIERLSKPRPEHYIEHARAILANEYNLHANSQAVAILDEGAQLLGHPISLHSFSVELERTSGLHHTALNRIDAVLERNRALVKWRLKRGSVLRQLHRPAEALHEMNCVIQTIEQLPEHRRRSDAMQTLVQRSRELAAQIKKEQTNAEPVNTSSQHQVSIAAPC